MLYFLPAGDTIDAVIQSLSNINVAKPLSMIVSMGEYTIKVISEGNGTKMVVYSSDIIDLSNESNVTMVLNKDASNSFGHNLIKL